MEGFTRKRSYVRSRRLSLEPLEERYLLTTLLNPAGGLTSPTVSAPPNIVVAPAASPSRSGAQPTPDGPSLTGGTSPDGATPSAATGSGVSPYPNPADGSPTTNPQSYNGSPSTVGSPKTGTVGRAGSVAGASPPSVDQRSAASDRSHDHDHGKSDNYRDDEDNGDDEDDDHDARLAEEASEARTATGTSIVRADDDAEDAESRVTATPSAGLGEEQQEPAPTTPAVSGAASEASALERPHPTAARAETAVLPDIPPGALAWRPAVEVQPAAAEVIEVPEARTAFGVPWSGAPMAGAVGVDMRLVEQGVHAFFARLTSLKGEAVSAGLTNGIAASWLTAVAAVALEIARARDRARRSSSGADGSAVLGCPEGGEGQ
jgi:hypothetical protein